MASTSRISKLVNFPPLPGDGKINVPPQLRHRKVFAMNSFGISATVQSTGDILVAGVPFAPGTEVEVVISPKRKSATEFSQAWQRVCGEIRTVPQAASLSDDDIQHEIDDYRAGR